MNVICFGTGRDAKSLVNSVKELDYTEDSILAFCDNNPNKWGGEFCDYPIISPMNIDKFDFDKIIITTNDYKWVIHNQLIDIGYTEDQVMFADRWYGRLLTRSVYIRRV